MVARGSWDGRPTEHNGKEWIYSDTKEPIDPHRECGGCQFKKVDVFVPIHQNDSHTGKARWAYKPVDFCCAGIVKALNNEGLFTRTSCCGHGKELGEIILWSGTRITLDWRGETDVV